MDTLSSKSIPIESVIADATSCVMASDTDAAYVGFGQEKVLIAFDSPDLLEDFARKNQASSMVRLLSAMRRANSGGSNTTEEKSTSHVTDKKKVREEYMKQLQELEDGNHG